MTKTILCCPFLKNEKNTSLENRFQESLSLTKAIDLNVINSFKISLSKMSSATLMGQGKVEEIAEFVKNEDIELVVIDTHVSPIQQRNLEIAWKAKVLDRTGLILEIFGRRASTKEGVLQVDLARLMYQKTRLVRAWSHLERQRGGGAFIGGPGETQKEMDRRIIDEKIISLKKQLVEVVRTRTLHRKNRKKVPYPIVALVGYTNAGKSTLFNMMTKASVLSADMLFATLDPTLRSIKLPIFGDIMLSDTVGFISDLPTQLIAAFKATLEEVIEADIILHVIDVSNASYRDQKKVVETLLSDVGVSDKTPVIEVWNKIDRLPLDETIHWQEEALRKKNRVALSAVTGKGIDKLCESLCSELSSGYHQMVLTLKPEQGKELAWLRENSMVQDYHAYDTGVIVLGTRISEKNRGLFQKTFPNFFEDLEKELSEREALENFSEI
jgi:GTPase